MSKFAGSISMIDRKSDDTNNDESVVIECTDLEDDGTIEIAFDDRNERCYVRFKLQDLVAAMCVAHIPRDA
jgi:hypothetical protein